MISPASTIIFDDAWTPADLFIGSEDGAWFDFSDLSTCYADIAQSIPANTGDALASIIDKSGNDCVAYQSVAASRPTVADGFALFDGANDFLRGAFKSSISVSDCTLAAGFLRNTGTGYWQQAIFLGDTTNGNLGANGVPHLCRRYNTSQFGMHNAWLVDTGIFANHADNADSAAVLRRSGSALSLAVKSGGQLQLVSSTQSWASNATNKFCIGTQDTDFSSTKPWFGRLYDIVVINRAISNDETDKLLQYFFDKLGIG